MKKLMNNHTGEIGYLYANKNENYNILDKNDNVLAVYTTLRDVGEHWEDVEEPKEWWYIDVHGPHKVVNNDEYYQQVKAASKEIGNCFETREEAERAVKKLEAWKRLKDKWFRFNGWTIDDGLKISICTNTDSDGIYDDDKKEMKKDLDICFGGEE